MLPSHVLQELEAYKAGQHPYPFGSFLTAILANDLVGATGGADEQNKWLIPEYASYLYNNMPGRTGNPLWDFWGSYEAVENTIRRQQLAQEAQVFEDKFPSESEPELAGDE